MKRIFAFFLTFVFILLVSSDPVDTAPTLIPKTIEFLYVSPKLSGGIVISDRNFSKETNNFGVSDDGTTNVSLVPGYSYIIKMSNGKYYYPNGDACVVPYSYALYIGENIWLNTTNLARLKTNKIKHNFIPYQVTWPPS